VTFGDDSQLASIGNSAFGDCTSLTRITIPDGVTSIGPDTFNGCSSLAEITLPASVTSIGVDAFSGCSSLTSITFLGSPPTVGADAFTDVADGATAIVPSEEVASYAIWNGLIVSVFSQLEAQLAQMTAERDAAIAALETAATSNATVIATLEAAATSNATVIATLELRPTLAEVQDARLGSVVLIKNEAGEINFDFKLEETGDLLSWTPVAGGTWTNPGDGGVEVDLPLAGDKRFYRVVVEFE
jgi:hypothetical protein